MTSLAALTAWVALLYYTANHTCHHSVDEPEVPDLGRLLWIERLRLIYLIISLIMKIIINTSLIKI